MVQRLVPLLYHDDPSGKMICRYYILIGLVQPASKLVTRLNDYQDLSLHSRPNRLAESSRLFRSLEPSAIVSRDDVSTDLLSGLFL